MRTPKQFVPQTLQVKRDANGATLHIQNVRTSAQSFEQYPLVFPVLLMNEEVTVSRCALHWGISRLTYRACRITKDVCRGRKLRSSRRGISCRSYCGGPWQKGVTPRKGPS